ncbi:MAG: DUF5312 domain-containing protein [Spirochaetaceae bacterium]|jgi:hypothetical protein|nr:DUF5312 domain-containing protein [Spirochaetaceae bacterium]
MGDNSAFERLSSGLSQYERLKLLEKISSYTDAADGPLINTEKDAEPSAKAEDRYLRLPWYRRLWFIILGFFTGKTSLEMFINSRVAEIGRGVDLMFPGIFNWQKQQLGGSFQDELKKLKEAARFFYGILDSGINRNRGAFFVLWGSIEMQELHARLSEKTDPSNFAADNPDFSDTKLRQMALDYVEKEINNIGEENRRVMYEGAHTLVCLKQLSSFLFDRFIMSFSQTAAESGPVCPAAMVKNQLVSLANILYSIKKSPSVTLLSAMFIFTMPEKDEKKEYDMENELQRFTSKAEKAVEVIRAFNGRVPLVRILRCVTRDTSYVPTELSGGEDWFLLFRKSWTENVSAQFDEFIKDRCRAKMQRLYSELFENFSVEPFGNIAFSDGEEGIPVNNIRSLSCLMMFHKKIFMPIINVFIRPILIDGEFARKENRTEFTEAYNVLIKLDDTIKSYAKRLEKSGDLGKRWEQIWTDVNSITVRHRKTSVILEDVNQSVDAIVGESRKAINSMESIIDGILYPAPGKSYDTLTNLAKISGKGTTFMDGMKECLEKLRLMSLLLETAAKLAEV